MSQQPLTDQDLLIIEALPSRSDKPHSVGILWTNDVGRRRDHYLTIHNIHNKQASMPRRAAADPRLRQCGQWNRQFENSSLKILPKD